MFPIILYSFSIAFFLVESFKLHVRFDIDRKPFNCVTCLSGWITLSWSLMAGNGWEAIAHCFVAMFLASAAIKIYYRL